jgi:excisionase family DNA binding protein
VKEASILLRVCTATIYKLCASGELPHFRIGASIRIRRQDLFRAMLPVR